MEVVGKQDSAPCGRQSVLHFVDLLRCPQTDTDIAPGNGELVSAAGNTRYGISASGVPLFAERIATPAARVQEAHYAKIAAAYVENLGYPHTDEYMKYLDAALLGVVDDRHHGDCAEICCGYGESFSLIPGMFQRGVGVDISLAMLEHAVKREHDPNILFVQGDATMLPLAGGRFDSVFMLGGIHHVPNRPALFREVARILKPGGRFYFREPLNDFALWRGLRAFVYRISPTLDYDNERPLRHGETVPVLEAAGLSCLVWRSYGFLGFILLMNSDVLIFNRLFRFIPGIRRITRAFAHLDDWVTSKRHFSDWGLQVIGVAQKAHQ